MRNNEYLRKLNWVSIIPIFLVRESAAPLTAELLFFSVICLVQTFSVDIRTIGRRTSANTFIYLAVLVSVVLLIQVPRCISLLRSSPPKTERSGLHVVTLGT